MKVLIIARREIGSYFDQPIAYVVIPAFLLLSGVYLFILNPFFMIDRATLRPFFEFTPFVFTLFIPAVAMRLIAEERRSGMLELLLSWPITVGDLVLGKFLGAAALIGIAIILTLVFPLSISAIGELDWGPVVGGYLGLFLLGAANLSVGLFVSALTRNQVIAFIVGFVVCFSFYICGRASALVDPTLGTWLEFFSFEHRFSSIARGVVDFRDLAFFCGTTAVFLGLATEAVRTSRWPRPVRWRRPMNESVAFLVLLILCAVMLNVAVRQGAPRIDLTENQRYTLAPATRALLNEAPGPISVHAFLPTHVQPPYSVVVTAMKDKLAEYAEAAPAGFDLFIVDPSDPGLDPAARTRLADEADGYGIQQRDLLVTQGDRSYRERVWFGVALLYADRRQVVAPVENPADLELALTRALKDLIRKQTDRPVIGITTGHGEPNLMASPLARKLAATGTLRAVSFDGNSISDDIDSLVILGPRKAYSEKDRYFIDQFLMRGGALVAFLDYRTPSSMFPDVLVNVQTGLEPLLASYGLVLDTRQTVIDRKDNLPAPATREGGPTGPNHPLYPRIKNLDPDHLISRGLSLVAAPMSVPITIEPHPGIEYASIGRAGPDARLRTEVRHAGAAAYLTPTPDEVSAPSAIVAATAEGTFPSAYAESGPPEGLGNRSEYPHIAQGHGDARIFVVTSGVRLLAAQQDGLLLLQNAVDWSTMETDLMSIRARARQEPGLSAADPTIRSAMKLGNILGPSLLCLLIGLVRTVRRRRS